MVLLILINFTSYGKLCDLRNWESFGTPLIIADLHNVSPNLTPAELTCPIKLLPQTPPAAKLTPDLRLEASGTTLSTGNPVHGADMTSTTSEQRSSKKSQLNH